MEFEKTGNRKCMQECLVKETRNCKGDTTNDSYTSGILLLKSDCNITRCSFAHHKSGAIMVDMGPQNKVLILENNIVSAETAGIYV